MQLVKEFPAIFTLPPEGRDTISVLIGEVRLITKSEICCSPSHRTPAVMAGDSGREGGGR